MPSAASALREGEKALREFAAIGRPREGSRSDLSARFQPFPKDPFPREPCSIYAELLGPTTEQWEAQLDLRAPEGSTQTVPMEAVWREQGRTVMRAVIVPTAPGQFECTIAAKAGDHFAESTSKTLTIKEPPGQEWARGPVYKEVAPLVSVGNAIAASQAVELGFQAVLNVAAGIDQALPPEVQYLKIGLPDGAHNPIPDDKLRQALDFIAAQVAANRRVLIHCRAGIGRSGSVGVAWNYKLHEGQKTYDEVVAETRAAKSDIYPHKGLRESLERMF